MYYIEILNKLNYHGYILDFSEIPIDSDFVSYVKINESILSNIEINEGFNKFILKQAKDGKPFIDKNGEKTIFFDEIVEAFLVSKEELIKKVNNIKLNLENTDYKVIKCYEAQLANEEMPYNLQELLAERKAWRDEINQLEFEIAMLN